MSQQAKSILEYKLFSNRKGNTLHSERVLCSERHLSGEEAGRAASRVASASMLITCSVLVDLPITFLVQSGCIQWRFGSLSIRCRRSKVISGCF
jgi:hypothetical protein